MKKYIWNPILECDDDDNNPTVWGTEVNSEKYGRFAWIEAQDVDAYAVTTSNYMENPLMICKSLTSAKRWVAMNIK